MAGTMKRLTKRLENGHAVYYLYELGAFNEIMALTECVDRLAAYEDTGLEPEEVQVVAEMFVGDPYVPILQVSNLVKAYREGRVEISLPNDPLTTDELQEMDGEPVWCGPYEWQICHGVSDFRGYPCLELGGGESISLVGYGDSWKAYRRKPKEG